MAVLLPEGKQSYETSTGAPAVGWKLYTYDAGTSTPRATYSDASGVTPNANPVILDARGEATIYWNGSYKVALKDSADVTIWTVDGVTSSATGAVVATDLTVSGTATFAGPLITPTAGPTALLQHALPAVASDTFVLAAATQTLTGKTLTTPIIAAIKTNAGASTITLPTTTDTLVGRATTDTLTNKTITGLASASTTLDSGGTGYTIGYRHIPQNTQAGNYTLTLTDNGKHINATNAAPQTVTIPTNASVAFPVGTVVVVWNGGTSDITVSTTSLTVYQAGTANTGNRTIATKGLASLLKVGTDTWVVSGSGIT